MRFLPLFPALFLAAAPLRAASPAAPLADWRQAQLPDPIQGALRGAGYGLEDDGKVLDPKTHDPITADQLSDALTKINLATEQLSLEQLRLLLAKGAPSPDDAAALKGNLPDEVAKALDAKASVADLRAITDKNLAQIASYFDGARTAAERAENASPVRAGAPGPRVPLPYFSESEKRLGDGMRAAAAAQLNKDPFGKNVVLARLDGPNGKPSLPPIVVETLEGSPAEYDYRRRALIVDSQSLADSITAGVAPKDRGPLEASFNRSRQALLDYANAHPEALAAFAASNDVLLAHELTHAWQDRRDPVMQEMSRGTLPPAVVIDYEEEAWITKNLYLQSKLKNEPASVADDAELADYRKMEADPAGWLRDLRTTYAGAASNAFDLATARSIQEQRLALERARTVTTGAEQTAKAQDLAAMTRAQNELTATGAVERARVEKLLASAQKSGAASPALLAGYYLRYALASPSPIDFSVRIQTAEQYAVKSGDAALLAKVRAAKPPAP